MQASITLRRIINSLDSYIKFRQITKAISQWKNHTSPGASREHFKVHILLVNDLTYVDLAEICIFSFLYHHPNTIFTLHCDGNTFGYASSKFEAENNITLKKLEHSAGSNWQSQKLEIILNMSGSLDLMLDADLRWNAPLGKIENVLFLVNEFGFIEKSPFREIIEQTSITSAKATMKNTSVFSFGNFALTKTDLNELRKTMREYRELLDSEVVGKLDKESIGRVIEQFTLSLCSETWAARISYVKDTDKPLDGGIVESCYFGATGGTF